VGIVSLYSSSSGASAGSSESSTASLKCLLVLVPSLLLPSIRYQTLTRLPAQAHVTVFVQVPESMVNSESGLVWTRNESREDWFQFRFTTQAGATRTLFYYYAKLRLDEAQTESSGFGSAKLSYGGQDIIELDSPAHLRQYSDASFLGRSYLW